MTYALLALVAAKDKDVNNRAAELSLFTENPRVVILGSPQSGVTCGYGLPIEIQHHRGTEAKQSEGEERQW